MLCVQVNSKCRCGGNTEGDNCERCQSLFNDRPWLPANGPNQTLDTSRQCQGVSVGVRKCNNHLKCPDSNNVVAKTVFI